ncbi:lysozyme inhibitor LprI family protein [Rhizobium sp. C4]|uniref:lysozyme inhibitor LprI family protein n=1 Tax=Rhizobium sp. C4 TaxID=1349800 RepID=UPI001E2F614C|nr:lysozyme inhibitor LprI family protein [Rhizobium sp. C4]MCD2171697.1 lysozyme inhibitor LprI family protein [Rhizobium sp. C4]
MKTIVRTALALGFVTLTGLAGHAARAASFDCDAKALAPDETAICANRELNDLDVRMATEFKWLSGMYAMGVRGELQDQQTAWLKVRQACQADVACIRKAYEDRLKVFEDDYNRFERPAPSK